MTAESTAFGDDSGGHPQAFGPIIGPASTRFVTRIGASLSDIDAKRSP
jgi:hypothetical protein